MTAFLFLQRFDKGVPASMPFQPIMDILSRYGKPGRGSGDFEITLEPDVMAFYCTIIGSPESGASCVGFERPRFDAALRGAVWECVERLGCAVFDDTLDSVYVSLDGASSLPADFLAACTNGVRQISSARQLWPEGLETIVDSPPRPAARYTNSNADGPNLQFFDHFDSNNRLYLEMEIRPEACNPGTLRVLRNLELRVDAAISANPEYSPVYRYANSESALRTMESPSLGKVTNRATIVSPPPASVFANGGYKPHFVANRNVFNYASGQAGKLNQYIQDKYHFALDGSVASIDMLAKVLDRLHASYCDEINNQATAQAASQRATSWAVKAGCYLGIVVQRLIGGQWGYVTCGQRRRPVVRTHRGSICHPFLQVFDHIINGPRDSISPWFHELAKSGISATPRGEDFVSDVPNLCMEFVRPGYDGGLPLDTRIPRDKLDFSMNSLHYLDQYLAQVSRESRGFSPQVLTKLTFSAGAYLGEVIRCNAPDESCWRWVNYDDFAQMDPGFVQKRPRELGFMGFLDSDAHTTYPLAHVAAIISGMNVAPTQVYARELVGK